MTAQNDSAIEDGHGHRWFLVLNGSRGMALVQRVGRPGYDTLRQWDQPEARMPDHVLGEDRPGRAFPAAGSRQRSGMEYEREDDSPKAHAKRDLLHQIARDAVEALRRGDATGLVLVAPAFLLTELRELIPQDLRHAIAGEHAGDWTQLPREEIFTRLDALRRGADQPPTTSAVKGAT